VDSAAAASSASPSASAASPQASASPASANAPKVEPKVDPKAEAPKVDPKVEPQADAPKADAPKAGEPPKVEEPKVTDAQAKALADAATKVAADKAAAEAAAATPETYDIKIPDPIAKAWQENGQSLDPALLPALQPALKKAGVTNAQFNEIAAAFLEYQQGTPTRLLARDLETTAKDPVLGGMRYGQTLAEVNVALNAFADPDFQKFVASAGIANRLEFVRVFQRIGAAMMKAGDTPSRGSPDAAPPETMAQRMYGRSKPKT
jgi:hypothetical protein